MTVLFEAIPNGISIQLLATVALSKPCPTVEVELDSVSETKHSSLEDAGDLTEKTTQPLPCETSPERCALAFSKDTGNVIDCLDEEDILEKDASKFSLLFS